MQGPSKLWEKLLLSLEVAGSEPGIEGEEIAPLANENVATPCSWSLIILYVPVLTSVKANTKPSNCQLSTAICLTGGKQTPRHAV